jgi:hypothetical protein
LAFSRTDARNAEKERSMARGTRSVVSLSARGLGACVALLSVAGAADASTKTYANSFFFDYLAPPYVVNSSEEKVIPIIGSELNFPQFSVPNATLLSVIVEATFSDDLTFSGVLLGIGNATISASATTQHCVTGIGVPDDSCGSSTVSDEGTTTRSDSVVDFDFGAVETTVGPFVVPADLRPRYVGTGTVAVSSSVTMTTVASVSTNGMLAEFEGSFTGTIFVTYEYALGDFDGSGTIDGSDLATLIGAWGTPNADLDGDGTTNAADLAILLGDWT